MFCSFFNAEYVSAGSHAKLVALWFGPHTYLTRGRQNCRIYPGAPFVLVLRGWLRLGVMAVVVKSVP